MNLYLIIEPTIAVLWCLAIASGMRRDDRADLMILLVAAPFSAVAEIVNRTLFAAQGTIYPATLLTFPGTDFPVAIVLFTGLYALTLYHITVRIVASVHRGRPLAATAVYLLLLLSAFLVEAGGTASGYWQYQRIPKTSMLFYLSVYGFYLFVTAPAMMVGFRLGSQQFDLSYKKRR